MHRDIIDIVRLWYTPQVVYRDINKILRLWLPAVFSWVLRNCSTYAWLRLFAPLNLNALYTCLYVCIYIYTHVYVIGKIFILYILHTYMLVCIRYIYTCSGVVTTVSLPRLCFAKPGKIPAMRIISRRCHALKDVNLCCHDSHAVSWHHCTTVHVYNYYVCVYNNNNIYMLCLPPSTFYEVYADPFIYRIHISFSW